MATIDTSQNYVTIINVFDVTPENAEKFLEVASRDVEEHISKLPGFVSSNFHISFDRKHVANYAQWETMDDLKNFKNDFEADRRMTEHSALVLTSNPIPFELRTSFGPST